MPTSSLKEHTTLVKINTASRNKVISVVRKGSLPMTLGSPTPWRGDLSSFGEFSVYLEVSQMPEQLPSSTLRLRHWRDYPQIVY